MPWRESTSRAQQARSLSTGSNGPEHKDGEFVKKPVGTWKVQQRIACPSSAQLPSWVCAEETFLGIQPFTIQARDQIMTK